MVRTPPMMRYHGIIGSPGQPEFDDYNPLTILILKIMIMIGSPGQPDFHVDGGEVSCLNDKTGDPPLSMCNMFEKLISNSNHHFNSLNIHQLDT